MEPASQAPKSSLTLTERLAAERTDLANERTLLAYGRTALGLVVTGTGFSEYLDSPFLKVAFFTLIPGGLIILALGIIRYRNRRKQLKRYQ
jgi:putative membrane protein